MKLLLIEDDRGIAFALSQALNDYEVDIASTGSEGLTRASSGDHAVILLDLNLPDISGLDVCQQLRKQGCLTPVVIMSCEAKVLSKIRLLDAGADDYLTKPFSLGELKARLRVVVRRLSNTATRPSRLLVGDLCLDSGLQAVERAGHAIHLRPKEFALLECLMQRAGTVVTRQVLGKHAWEENQEPWTNTIDVHIKYLRDKIDRPFNEPTIKTVHGLGYKLEAATLTVGQPQEAASVS